MARSVAALEIATCRRASTRRRSSSIFLRLVGDDYGSAGDVSTHAVGLSCESLPPVHNARHQLAQPSQVRVRVVRAVGPDRGGKVTLELNIGSVRSGWVVLAGEASSQVLEDLLIVQVWDGA